MHPDGAVTTDTSKPKAVAGKHTPELSATAVTEIIQEASAKKNVKQSDIPEEEPFTTPENAQHSKRYFEVKGYARFFCENNHRWVSGHSWCFVDLKKQVICYRDTQKCWKCPSKTTPEFTRECFQEMAMFVVHMYLIKTRQARTGFSYRTARQQGSHITAYCSKCKRLGRGCWT